MLDIYLSIYLYSDSLFKSLLKSTVFQFKGLEYYSSCYLLEPQDPQQEWSDPKHNPLILQILWGWSQKTEE